MPAPLTINVYFDDEAPPIVCHSVGDMDAAFDRLDAETRTRLQTLDAGEPLAITVQIPGFQIYTGVGVEESYVSVAVEPCDGDYYAAVGDPNAVGESRMFYGSGQDSYWAPRNLLPSTVARAAVRHFVEHQRDLPGLRWEGPG